jgi:enolase
MAPTKTLEEPFEHLLNAIHQTDTNCAVALGTDIAASSFVADGGYELAGERFTSPGLAARLTKLRNQFPTLTYVEDPAGEDDMPSFTTFLASNPRATVIGDDVTTTNKDSLAAAVKAGAINGIIIKPNQIGTVSATLETMRLAYQHKVRCIVSHRSGETMDDFIADLAWGTKSFGLKTGAPTAKERLAKYQRLLAINS